MDAISREVAEILANGLKLGHVEIAGRDENGSPMYQLTNAGREALRMQLAARGKDLDELLD